jgi:Cys-tRNA(Pro) deacylase
MNDIRSFNSPVTEFLDDMGIPYQIFTHPGTIHSLEQAAEERGQVPDQIVRSILFRVGHNEFVMVLITGKKRVSWSVLRQLLRKSRITMATEDEVLRCTGFTIGAVSPFNLRSEIRVLVDQSVLSPTEISIGSGKRGTAIILSQENFRKCMGNWVIVNLTPPTD